MVVILLWRFHFQRNRLGHLYNIQLPLPLVGSATPTGWPTGAPNEVDAQQMATANGLVYTINTIALTASQAKFRADNSWFRQWGANTFPTGIAYQQEYSDINIAPAGTYGVTFNVKTGAFAFTAPLSTEGLDTAYPNPTKDNWNFASSNENIKSIQVFDVTGKVILSKIISAKEVTLDASGLSNGIYFAKVATESASATLKLVLN